jgi:hypothetical protein
MLYFKCSQIWCFLQVLLCLHYLINFVFVCEEHAVWLLFICFSSPVCSLSVAGDYGNENVQLVRSISDLQFPKAAILGNHDCWRTHQFSEKYELYFHLVRRKYNITPLSFSEIVVYLVGTQEGRSCPTSAGKVRSLHMLAAVLYDILLKELSMN